ncbi:elongation of very long chain fatty acids protein 6-like protein, partial [Leptotrombidium deliense]
MNVSKDWSKFPGIPLTFSFEANFDMKAGQRWMKNNLHFPIIISIIYVIMVFAGRRVMQNRKAFDLRTALFLWSLSLAIFSLFGTIRVLPEILHVISSKGIVHSFCVSSFKEDIRVVFWIWLFVWSKVAELVDTAFVILRKQKFIHLHWIHHALTLIYAFMVCAHFPGFTRWLVAMNFSVHVCMYSYYALRAVGVRTPKFLSVMITSSQIAQMIAGCVVCCTSFAMFLMGKKCENNNVIGTCG